MSAVDVHLDERYRQLFPVPLPLSMRIAANFQAGYIQSLSFSARSCGLTATIGKRQLVDLIEHR
jgi:hypothetical protein